MSPNNPPAILWVTPHPTAAVKLMDRRRRPASSLSCGRVPPLALASLPASHGARHIRPSTPVRATPLHNPPDHQHRVLGRPHIRFLQYRQSTQPLGDGRGRGVVQLAVDQQGAGIIAVGRVADALGDAADGGRSRLKELARPSTRVPLRMARRAGWSRVGRARFTGSGSGRRSVVGSGRPLATHSRRRPQDAEDQEDVGRILVAAARVRRRRPASGGRGSPPGCSRMTRVSPTVLMKLVSPAQRGSRCRCRWSGIPAPRTRRRCTRN